MDRTYEWLYDNYAAPLIQKIKLSQDEWEKYLSKELALSVDKSVILNDAMTNMRLYWGAEIFALGLQLGIRLVHPEPEGIMQKTNISDT